ncbi:glutaminase [Acinetobacter ursingii]|uniref:Glutaminase n=1 Tax=Acinetobacter ursingii TaxID=108980 RepID=A0A7T9UI60_9GAMM|nr:glutaminase [Acinetobacter ursingii]NOZ96894.1 glutaminase [Gammaproteobacteria bacterium]MCU4356639.1 glutaminase [Acinetobacter ursingii]MDH2020620.1 glutaminase [Acinetobacter ursingii]MDH2072928.1 glutaminase [Acinetobacter ursingii]MDH2104322.1 glutaminase [Acinetobacter ursingii]
MKTPLPDYLEHVLDECDGDDSGHLADYIPELANANSHRLALAMSTVDGEIYSVGDDDVEFTIQSMSKPFTYAYVLQQLGIDEVLEKVGVEPSGEAFNEISLGKDGRPKNPMINSGAITTHSLIPIKDNISSAEILRQFMSELAGRELCFDDSVYHSEIKTAYRNLSIGYMLRTVGILETDPVDIVNGYIRQCSILVTVKDLVRMGSVLANGGVDAQTGKRLLNRSVVRQVLSVMMSCGMYDAAGDWLTTVGIPAKSGVAGGILGVLPGQVSIAAFSPKLDEHGNSVRGIDMMERLSRDMGLHLMEGTPSAQTIVQSHYRTGQDASLSVYVLRGVLKFTEAEMLLRIFQREPVDQSTIIIDLTQISLIHDVGKRMFLEGVDRLIDDGHSLLLVDPEQRLDHARTHKDRVLHVYQDLDDLLEQKKDHHN